MLGVLLAALLGVGGSTAVQLTQPVRHQAFTQDDARKLKQDIYVEIERQFKISHDQQRLIMMQMEAKIRKDIPPDNLKMRILQIEQELNNLNGYRPPTLKWNGE